MVGVKNILCYDFMGVFERIWMTLEMFSYKLKIRNQKIKSK